MAYKELPDVELLRKLLNYNPETGVMIWKARPEEDFRSRPAFVQWNKRNVGNPALASVGTHGYAHGAINGMQYYAHRILWKLHTGADPIAELDHINGIRTDNRIANLREVSRLLNTQNRKLRSDCKHGVPGVHWHDQCQKWKVTINNAKQRVYIGVFVDFDEAVAARRAAEVKYGFHPNHGRDG